MKRTVIPTPDAEAQIMYLGNWWRQNRSDAPDLFKQRLERAWRFIEISPGIGQLYPYPAIPNVRRIRIKDTPYHVYYVVNQNKREVTVLAVWSGTREEGPPLRMPSRS